MWIEYVQVTSHSLWFAQQFSYLNGDILSTWVTLSHFKSIIILHVSFDRPSVSTKQEKEPIRQEQAKVDKREQKFKPRLNVVWQQRLENSKIGREKKDDLALPAAPKNSLFNSIIPKK